MSDFLKRVLPPLPPRADFQPCYYMVGIDAQGIPHPVPFLDIDNPPIQQLAGQNTYISPASYKDLIFGRKAANALQAKAIWADIDVGKEKNSYATLDEAITALASFAQNTGLKPTVIVHSGVGLQAYWTFDKPLDISTWKLLARCFAVLCRQHGLVIDPACTEDAARILRMPGTLHLKSGNTASVLRDYGTDWNVKEFYQKLKQHLKNDAALTVQSVSAMTDTQRAYEQFRQPLTARAEPIARGCKCVLTAGLASEPQWFGMMGVLRSCVDGLEWAHKLSAFDPARYDEQACETKFYHATENAPTRCATFEAIAPELCAQCPHRGKLTSPIQLGNAPVVTVAEQPAPVEPASDHIVIPNKFEYPLIAIQSNEFYIADDGMYYNEPVKTQDGWQIKARKLCSARLYYTHSVCDTENNEPRRTHWFVVVQPNGKRQHVPFVIQRSMTPNTIMRWFYEANTFPESMGVKTSWFMGLMTAYLKNVIGAGQGVELPTLKKFGWTTLHDDAQDCDYEGFALGPGIVTEQGLKPAKFAGVAERIAREELQHKGTLDKWKFIPQMYRILEQPVAQLAVCLSFAAPLMRYGTGIATSGIFSLWSSRSGRGKSQVMRACASIWGDPDKQFIQRHSSAVLRMRKLSTISNLPCYMDELTDVKDEDMYSLAYTLVDGREKQKLRSSGAEMVETGDWKTMTFTTANKSFKEAAAKVSGDSDASILRVMEYECDFESYEDNPDVRRYIQTCIELCREHYGVAGAEFMYQLMRHSDRLYTLTSRVDDWSRINNFTTEERYMSSPLALAVIAGRWAVEWGLLDYDMDALEDWILQVFVAHNRGMTAENVVRHDQLIADYLSDRQCNTLIVSQCERDADMQPAPRGMPDKFIMAAPTRETYVRIEAKEREIYIAYHDLQRWCQHRKLSVQVLLRELKFKQLPVQVKMVSLSTGIGWMPQVPVKAVRISGLDLNSLLIKTVDKQPD